MEAQYALQKKKALVPLMMTEGYEADGWLGLLLGTSMWYGFYGETLSSGSAFESRMDALCREIGSRGRADAVVAAAVLDVDPKATSSQLAGIEMTPLAAELRTMKGSALRKRAVACGVSDAELEEADDDDDTSAALVKLIVARELANADGEEEAARAKLLATKTSLLRKQVIAAGATPEAMERADDAADTKAALVEMILRGQQLAAGEGAR